MPEIRSDALNNISHDLKKAREMNWSTGGRGGGGGQKDDLATTGRERHITTGGARNSLDSVLI